VIDVLDVGLVGADGDVDGLRRRIAVKELGEGGGDLGRDVGVALAQQIAKALGYDAGPYSGCRTIPAAPL
jgi:hypothetical protein